MSNFKSHLMRGFRAFWAATGTASGVALSFFGLCYHPATQLVGMVIAGAVISIPIVNVIVASTTAILFLVIWLPVARYVYKEDDKTPLLAELQKQEEQKNKLLLNYLLTLLRQYYIYQAKSPHNTRVNLSKFIEIAIDEDISKTEFPNTITLLRHLRHDVHTKQEIENLLNILDKKYKTQIIQNKFPINKNINDLFNGIKNNIKNLPAVTKSPNTYDKNKHGFLGFNSACGSTLGFCAGLAGLLAGIGLFSGFGTIPTLIILLAGTMIGIIMAAIFLHQLHINNNLSQLIAQCNAVNNDIESITTIRRDAISTEYLTQLFPSSHPIDIPNQEKKSRGDAPSLYSKPCLKQRNLRKIFKHSTQSMAGFFDPKNNSDYVKSISKTNACYYTSSFLNPNHATL